MTEMPVRPSSYQADHQQNARPSEWPPGGGEMGERIRTGDWSQTGLGPIEQWPAVLSSTLSLCLSARFPMAIYWGRQGFLLYNDAWRPILGHKHPWAIGRPAREVWPEIWDAIAPLFESVLTTGEATWRDDELLAMERFGYREECYFDYTFNPIRSPAGTVLGILNVVRETTYRVLNERRTRLLGELAACSGSGKDEEHACELVMSAIATDRADIPFALLYLIDQEERRARLIRTTGLPGGGTAGPTLVDLTVQSSDGGWPLAGPFLDGAPITVDDVAERFGPLPSSAWPEPVRQAIVLPITAAGPQGIAAMLVAGVSPRRPLDENYRDFFMMVQSHMAAAIANARAYWSEKQRAEALAELDRAKTAFFSNVSHEFRTPLTLMLGPIEEELRERPHAPRLEVAHRNSLRLLRLVNQLLDFSLIEAGRVRALYEPTDLARFTAELAGVFRSAVEKAGLALAVDCKPLGEAVYVDRDMWEKILFNLISNALKFTLEGSITVTLRPVSFAFEGEGKDTRAVELSVRDTGTGIPPEELSRIFDRFHRVKGARSRTHEGSGIGLALVQELVKLHGGSVRVESPPGGAGIATADEGGRHNQGSTFIVTLPFGAGHLPSDKIGAGGGRLSTATAAGPYVDETLRWLPDPSLDAPAASFVEEDVAVQESPVLSAEGSRLPSHPPAPAAPGRCLFPGDASRATRSRVLVVDDNADMRQYIARLLAERYRVLAASDGEAALALARAQPPDLILSDVMMPRLDGFGLLRALRADPATKTIPVILLSARAGEESRVEGLEQGADDYLIKPFSARELLARVGTHVDMGRIRREAEAEIGRSKLFMERLAASTPDMLFVFDVIDGRHIYINRSLEAVLGYTADHIRSMKRDPTEVIVHPDDLPGVRQWYARFDTATDDQILEHELRARHADGSYRWILARATVFERTAGGRAKQIIGVATDFTERKRADEAKARLAAIVESSDDAIISKGLDGVVTSWNAGAERLFGYTAQEAVGRPITMLMPPERVHEEALILERIRRGERIRHYETIRRRKDGTLLDISLTVSPLADSGGTIVGASKIARDITERRRSEEALRESEARFRMLADTAPVLIWMADTTKLCTWFNKRWLDFTGRSMEQEVGNGWAELLHPDDLDRCLDLYTTAFDSRQPFSMEYRMRRHDGCYRWILDTGIPRVSGNGEFVGYIGSCLDITERKGQEIELATRSRQQVLLYELAEAVNRAEAPADLYEKALDAILNSLNADRASILLFDDDGVMRFKAWRGLSDHYRDAVEGHSPWERSHQDAQPIIVSRIAEAGIGRDLQAVIRQEGIEALAFIPLTYGGRLIGKFMVYFNRAHTMSNDEIDLAMAIAGTLALGIDRKAAEETLRTSEERLRLAMASSCMGAWDIELDSGAVTWDAKQCDLFGLPVEKAPASMDGFYALIHPDDVANVQKAAAAARETGQFYYEFRIVRPDGQVRWIVGHGATVPDRMGHVARMVGVNYDITDRKESQQRLESFAEELELQVHKRTNELSQSRERLRALAAELNLTEQRERQRLATELHDYLAQLLALSKIKLAQARRQQLNPPAGKVVGELQEIMDQALAYTRSLVAQLTPPVLNEFGLPTALRWLAEQMMDRSLTVTLELHGDIVPLPEDQAVLLFQSVRELLMNVLKHGQTNRARITVTQSGQSLAVTVADQGVGFDRAAVRSSSVSGFGLFSIRERMLALGGRFELNSAPGEGTTATLVLPLHTEDAQRGGSVVRSGHHEERDVTGTGPVQAPGHQPSARGIASGLASRLTRDASRAVRVLLVDDHAMVRQGLRGLLDAYADIEVIGEGADGEEAVALGQALQPDVIVMDANMPKLDGIEAARRLKHIQPQVVIIGLSVADNGHIERAMLEAGAAAFHTKEAAVEELYRSIQASLMKSRES